MGSPRRKPFSSWKESVDVRKQRPAEGWHLHRRAARAARLTFDQGVLVCGGGARQHSQLWPDLVDSLLLNLERDVGEGGSVRLGREAGPEKGGDWPRVTGFLAHWLASVQSCRTRASRPPSHARPSGPRTSPFSLRILRLNSLPSRHRKSSPGWMMPHLMAMARAVLILSPVTMRTVMPARWHFRMASGTWKGGQEPWGWSHLGGMPE